MKQENSTLLRKLKAYSAMAGSFVAIAATANGQAFYTDIDPDVTVNENGLSYLLDLDNDGTTDYAFEYTQATATSNGSTYSYRGIFAKPYGANSIAGSTTSGRVYPFPLDAGANIDAALAWHNDDSQTMGSVKAYPSGGSTLAAYGKFYGAVDKYIPLRFKIAGVNHYGWARFDVADDLSSFTIKDYAYNTAATTGLFAGQGDPTGVQAVPTPVSVKIFAYDGMVNAIIINQKINNATLEVTDMVGQQVKSMTVTHEVTRLDVSDLPMGIYAVTVTNNGTPFTSKVSLRR